MYDIDMSTDKKCHTVFTASFLYKHIFKWIQPYFQQFLEKKKNPTKMFKNFDIFQNKIQIAFGIINDIDYIIKIVKIF